MLLQPGDLAEIPHDLLICSLDIIACNSLFGRYERLKDRHYSTIGKLARVPRARLRSV
jgi:hypothetical protein